MFVTSPKVISRKTSSKDLDRDYRWGFVTDIETETAPKGLNKDVVRFISSKKEEPDWLLEWRLKAYDHFLSIKDNEPKWAMIDHSPIDLQNIHYYSAPKAQGEGPRSLDEVDPELIEAFDKLGIPIQEQKKLAGVVVPIPNFPVV